MPYADGGDMSNDVEAQHIACPSCKNKRLFDLLPGSTGYVNIKCPVCKNVIAVSLYDGSTKKKEWLDICTEQIGAQ